MPTNEERREVAEEMRQRMYEGYSFTGFNISDQIGICGDEYNDPYLFHDDCWKRLAELIEPEAEKTCKRVKLYDAGGVWYEGCSNCRNPIDHYDVYCSKCGAKVVD